METVGLKSFCLNKNYFMKGFETGISSITKNPFSKFFFTIFYYNFFISVSSLNTNEKICVKRICKLSRFKQDEIFIEGTFFIYS